MAIVAKANPSEVAIENSWLSCLNLSVFIPWQSQKNIAGKSATLKKAPLHEAHLIFLSKIGLPLSQTKNVSSLKIDRYDSCSSLFDVHTWAGQCGLGLVIKLPANERLLHRSNERLPRGWSSHWPSLIIPRACSEFTTGEIIFFRFYTDHRYLISSGLMVKRYSSLLTFC